MVKVEEGGRDGKGLEERRVRVFGKEERSQKKEGGEIWIHGSGLI